MTRHLQLELLSHSLTEVQVLGDDTNRKCIFLQGMIHFIVREGVDDFKKLNYKPTCNKNAHLSNNIFPENYLLNRIIYSLSLNITPDQRCCEKG